jgi:hypothetical protein
VDIHYLTEMEVGSVLGQLQNLPEHFIEVYASFFQDSAGTRFLNATKAPPLIDPSKPVVVAINFSAAPDIEYTALGDVCAKR